LGAISGADSSQAPAFTAAVRTARVSSGYSGLQIVCGWLVCASGILLRSTEEGKSPGESFHVHNLQDLQNEAQAGRPPVKKSPIMLAGAQQMKRQPKRSAGSGLGDRKQIAERSSSSRLYLAI
jgi:hypothetical protein